MSRSQAVDRVSSAAALLALALVASCYSPQYRDCQFTCDGATACPSGLTCASGFCRSSAEPLESCELVLQPDATPSEIDANPSDPDADPADPDANPLDPDASPSDPDAAVPVIDAAVPVIDAAVPVIDAAVPVIDAAVPVIDASTPVGGLCNVSQPYLPPCGGQVLCVKSIKATTVKARVIYAKDVKTVVLDDECVFETPSENHWMQGDGGGNLQQPMVEADVIYVKDLQATTIQVIELRAKKVTIGP